LRKKSDKPVGGQCGHEGHTLNHKEKVDNTVECAANYCPDCGADLREQKGTVVETPQMIDIPLTMPLTTDYNLIEKTCSCCGKHISGRFPKGVNAPVFYGPNIQATIVYLVEAQHIAIKRVTELMNEFYHVPISQGTVCNIIEKIKEGARPAYNEIHDMIKSRVPMRRDGEPMNSLTGCGRGRTTNSHTL